MQRIKCQQNYAIFLKSTLSWSNDKKKKITKIKKTQMMTALIFASFIFCREIRLQNMLAITTNQLYLICYKKKILISLDIAIA